MSLTKLELKNVLSFGPNGAELELKKLNMLIGPNGSGKSNLIEAITLLRAAPRELTVPVREGGGVRDWLWKDRGASAVAEITATLDYPSGSMPLRHSISFAEVSQRFQVTDERVENVRPLPGREKPYFYFGREGTRFMLNVATAGPRYLRQRILTVRSLFSRSAGTLPSTQRLRTWPRHTKESAYIASGPSVGIRRLVSRRRLTFPTTT
jgi:predicted ATPase